MKTNASTPVGLKPIDGVNYTAFYLPDGGYAIARTRVMGSGEYLFDYYKASTLQEFTAAWRDPVELDFKQTIDLSADLSVLFTPTGSPEVQKTFVTNRPEFTPVTNYQKAGQPPTPLLVTLTNPSAGGNAVDTSALAKDVTVAATNTSLGTDGTAAPSIAGTGVRGWLRAIYEKLLGGLAVTGTFWQATQPVSLAAVPLATGAATVQGQVEAIARLESINNKLAGALTVTFPATQQIAGTVAISGTVPVSLNFPSTQAVSGPLTDTQLRATPIPVSATILPLPTGAATSALQTAGNASLGTLAANSPALVGGRVPVDLGSTTLSVGIGPRTSGGLASRAVLTNGAGTATPTVVKATAGQVYTIDAANEGLTKVYLNFYAKSTAPVAGDVPVLVYVLLPSATMPRVSFDALGMAFPNGIALSMTSANVVTGLNVVTNLLSTVLTGGQVTVNIGYA